MRRAQFDISEQPIRNLVVNPGGEAGFGTTVVRTNLALNPNFTATSGTVTVRTNLALNPDAATTSNWSNIGGATHTRTADTTVFHRGTSSNKATLTGSGSLGSKCTVSGGFVTGDTVSWSIWVYPSKQVSFMPYWERATPTYAGGTGGSYVVCPANTWTQLTGTVTFTSVQADASGSFGFGVYAGLNEWVAGDYFCVDELIVEKAGVVGTYFDGTTAAANGLTYSWSGAANASASNEVAPAMTYWATRWFGGSGGAGVTFQHNDGTSDGPYLRKLWKITNNGSTQDAGIATASRINVNASTPYTISIMVRSSVSHPFNGVLEWYDSAGTKIAGTAWGTGTVTVPANTWTRISVTATSASTAASLLPIFGPYGTNNVQPAGATIDFDLCLVEAVPAALPYFDGSTVAAGDFTYAWSGTAYFTPSLQRAAGLANWASASLGSGYQSSTEYVLGAKSVAVQTRGGSGDGVYITDIDVTPGVSYTMSAWIKLTSTLPSLSFVFRWKDGIGANGGTILYDGGTTVHSTLVVGQWVRVSTTSTAPAGAAKLQAMARTYAAHTPTTYYIDGLMITSSPYASDFIDPDRNVLAKWDGTAHASTSVGYPPTLSQLVGAPLLDLTTTNNVIQTLDDSFGLSEPRTIYTVFDQLLVPGANVFPIVTIGDTGLLDATANSTMMLRTQGNTTAVLNRRTSGLGPFSANVLTVGRNVSCWGMTDTGVQFIQNNGAAYATSTQVMNVPHQAIRVHAPSTVNSLPSHAHVRTLVFRGFHDTATRAAVSRYLGNKYGAPVA